MSLNSRSKALIPPVLLAACLSLSCIGMAGCRQKLEDKPVEKVTPNTAANIKEAKPEDYEPAHRPQDSVANDASALEPDNAKEKAKAVEEKTGD